MKSYYSPTAVMVFELKLKIIPFTKYILQQPKLADLQLMF